MLSPKEGQYLVIAAIAIAILFVIAFFAIIVYWIRRIQKKRSKTNIEDHGEVTGEKEPKKKQSVVAISSENEETDNYEDIMTTALTEGIKLIVYSCIPKTKPFRILLATSWQPGTEPRIGVFNLGKMIKQGTVFGPYQSEKEFTLIQKRGRNKYWKGGKKLEKANNWLGFINKASKEKTNVNIIQKNDDGTYYFESSRDISHGEEVLAILCLWERNEKKY